MQNDSPENSLSQDNKQKQDKESRRAAVSGWIGSTLEYYDFFIYASAAAIVFPSLFFPSGNPTLAIIASVATYGVGYVARPIGATILGNWGDRHGRKNVLVLCMLLMGFSTICVGLLPTYEQIGILAPIILVILRLIQGFAVAGEMSGAGSLILEQAPQKKRAFYASFTQQGSSFGQLLAAGVFIPLSLFLSSDAFMSWGWRIPFLLSIFVIIAGVMIRRHVSETAIFKKTQQNHLKKSVAPIRQALRYHWKDMIKVGFMSLNNIVPVVITIFGGVYATQAAYGIHISKDAFFLVPMLSHLAAVVFIPIMGGLSDYIGRRPLMMIGIIASGATCILFLQAIEQGNFIWALAYSVIGWGIIYQGFNAVYPAFYPELFPANVRVTSVALPNNIGVPLAALCAPIFVWMAPPGSENIPMTIGLSAFAITCIVALAVFFSRETYHIRTEALGCVPAALEKSDDVLGEKPIQEVLVNRI